MQRTGFPFYGNLFGRVPVPPEKCLENFVTDLLNWSLNPNTKEGHLPWHEAHTNSGSTSCPFASKSDWGKAKYGQWRE